MKHAGQVVTRAMLLEHVWNYHFDLQTNVIDVHISRLRTKIDKGFDVNSYFTPLEELDTHFVKTITRIFRILLP